MLIPSIDLQGGRIVQLVQGEKLAVESTDIDSWVRRFRPYPKVQVIDLDAAKGNGDNSTLVARICGQLPCRVGGGIRSVARARDVLRQFLIEAILLSVVGGALGILAGYWLAPLLTKFAGFPTLISTQSVVLAFSVSAIIGVVFGFFPALKAANLDPIDALRYE